MKFIDIPEDRQREAIFDLLEYRLDICPININMYLCNVKVIIEWKKIITLVKSLFSIVKMAK